MKDKSAGLKTISIICLGSALFTLMSYKMGLGDSEDSTRIASYIVSGVGFLGAGVIFKEGFTVYGLTTAGIIWISAAIEMVIGFGEFYTAFTFIFGTLLVIHGTHLFSHYLQPKHNHKILHFELTSAGYEMKDEYIAMIKHLADTHSITKLEKKEDGHIVITIEMKIKNRHTKALEIYLMNESEIVSFSI